MIKVNKKDGKTLSFDLEKDTEYIDIQKKLDDDVFIGEITGINSLFNTFWHALTLPKNFRNVTYDVEKVKHFKNGIEQTIGEKIVCHADDVRLTILVYYNTCPKMARIELKKVGKQRFTPKRSTAHGVDGKEN